MKNLIIWTIWIIILTLILSSCYYRHRMAAYKEFTVTTVNDSVMVLNNHYRVKKCNGCQIGDKVTAFRIGN